MNALKQIFVAIGVLVLASCAALTPINKPGPKDLVMTPVADMRVDKTLEIDFEKVNFCKMRGFHNFSSMWVPPQRCLEEKGYNPVVLDNYGSKEIISVDDIENIDPNWMASMGPVEADLVLLISINDAVSRKTFGCAFSVECSGILYNKDSKEVVWENSINYDLGVGGLAGAFYVDITPVAGCCVMKLLKSMPDRD